MEEGDLDVDLRTSREDEIGRLFVAFDSMRRALRRQIREAEAAREEAEQSRRELQRQNERLDQFASTVSHDLRNPLNVASGHLRLIERKADDLGEEVAESLESHVEKTADAHDRMEAIIGDVLALAREGRDIEETQPVDLGTIARDAWETVDSGEAAFAVAGTRTIEADPDRLRQAFENLLRNAVDHGLPDREDGAVAHGGEGPLSVEVGLTETGFYVADDGSGIPSDAVEDVFEYGHTTDPDGTGFGWLSSRPS
ncbi:sensor histidine kinase [Halosimplex aquaticum]